MPAILIIIPTYQEAGAFLRALKRGLESPQTQTPFATSITPISPSFKHELRRAAKYATLPLLDSQGVALSPLVFEIRGARITVVIPGMGALLPLLYLQQHFSHEELKQFHLVCLSGVCAITTGNSASSSQLIGKTVSSTSFTFLSPNFIEDDTFAQQLHHRCYSTVDFKTKHKELLAPEKIVKYCLSTPWSLKNDHRMDQHISSTIDCPAIIEMEAYSLALMAEQQKIPFAILKIVSDSLDTPGDSQKIAARMPELSQTCCKALCLCINRFSIATD